MEVIYRIKTATVNDILTHLKECNDNFYPPLTERVDLEDYSQKIFEKSVTFEAWKEGFLVGLVAIYFNENADHSAYITNVSVLKRFMSAGIASELLGQCIAYAIRGNFMEIKLEVNEESSYAINLYKKFDFIVDSTNGMFLKMKLRLIK